MSDTPLSQMFENTELNKATGLFEKNYGNKPVEYVKVVANNGQVVLNKYTSSFSNIVYLPENIENLGKTLGLMAMSKMPVLEKFSIHLNKI